jgi:hypothetical protein
MKEFKPITAREKFGLATKDAFDPGTFVLAGFFAGKGQLLNSDPSLGQGMKGYGRRYAASYGDFAIADYMTEGVFPTLLHHDNRYFRRATGSVWSRLGHAIGSTFVTYKDSGGRTFNFSEVGGNAAAVAISTAYYPDSRFGSETVGRWGIQMGLDTAANVMKEFWPDMQGKLTGKKGR